MYPAFLYVTFLGTFSLFTMCFGNKYYDYKVNLFLSLVFFCKTLYLFYILADLFGIIIFSHNKLVKYSLLSILIGLSITIIIHHLNILNKFLYGSLFGGVIGHMLLVGTLAINYELGRILILLISTILGSGLFYFLLNENLQKLLSTSIYGSFLLMISIDYFVVSGFYFGSNKLYLIWIINVLLTIFTILSYFIQSKFQHKLESLLKINKKSSEF